MFKSNAEGIVDSLKEDDILIFDCGFRNAVEKSTYFGLVWDASISEHMMKQHTTEEFNSLRLVTKLCSAVEETES